MKAIRERLKSIFGELDRRIERINKHRMEEGLAHLTRSEVKVLGQMSLMANEKVSAILTLAQTADLDALLAMEPIVKTELKALLKENGLLYDEDSSLIWVPKGAKFEKFCDLPRVVVSMIDAESALVSKAVKAPAKNKQLVRQAIASRKFPALMERIAKNGGDLEFFAK